MRWYGSISGASVQFDKVRHAQNTIDYKDSDSVFLEINGDEDILLVTRAILLSKHCFLCEKFLRNLRLV